MTNTSDQQPSEAWTFLDWCRATAFYDPDQSIAHHHRIFQEATESLHKKLALEISIVCISGTAGDGKTNLAWHAMRRALDEGLFTHFDWVTDRSMYVDSNGEPRPTGLPALHTDSIFNSMIKHFSWDELKLRATNLASQCAQRFREGHYCLVLDNMETQGQLEHFLKSLSGLVHPKVPRTSRILITSRVEYPTMNVKFMPIKGLASEAVIQYIQYVERNQNNVLLTDDERQALAVATGGNPLFIQIAIARYARAQTWQKMSDLIEHMQKGDRFYKAFQNLFGGLYDALSATARQIALDAAVYGGEITQEDLLSDAAMHTEDEDAFEQALAELVDQRVLVPSNVRGTYTMHPLIRAYLTRVKDMP